MYLRSQDILHVIFVLHGGCPVHLDLLLRLLLGLGFSKLYPKRHVALLFCVLWSLVISLSPPVSSLHWVRPGRTQHWLDLAPPRVVCAKLCSADGLSWAQCPAQSTGPAPDLERNLSLELSATGWHSQCPGPHPHHGGGVLCMWRYLYLKIWPLLCFVDDVKTESRVFMDHLASNLFEFWEFSIIMHMLKIETQVRCYRTTLHCAYELEVWNNCPLFVGRLWPSPRVTGESSLVHYLCSGLPPLLSRYQTSHITYQYSDSDSQTLSAVCSLFMFTA